VVAAVLVAAASASVVGIAAGWAPTGFPAWTALAALVVLAASLTLATFVPRAGSGRVVEVGCGPCAAMTGVASVAAVWIVASSAHDAGQASVAAALAGFALAKRLTDPEVCATR
jgi:hypothetical protein